MTASVRAEEALDSDIESSWRLQQDEDEDWDEDEEWDEGEDDYNRGPRRHPDEWH